MFFDDRLARLLDKVSDLQDDMTSLRNLFLLAFERLENLMSDRGALDAAITTLGSETSSLVALAQSLITKGQANAASPIDYTAEIAQIGTIQDNINAALTNANAAASAPSVGQTAPVTPPATSGVSSWTSTAGTTNAPSSPPPSTLSGQSSAPQTATGSNA